MSEEQAPAQPEEGGQEGTPDAPQAMSSNVGAGSSEGAPDAEQASAPSEADGGRRTQSIGGASASGADQGSAGACDADEEEGEPDALGREIACEDTAQDGAADEGEDHAWPPSNPQSSMPSRRVSSAYGSRPGSAAWKELRGSRPNSALVAQQIEGYDSDFLASTAATAALKGVPEGELTEAGGDWEANLHTVHATTAEGPSVQEQIARLKQEQQALLLAHDSLQQRVRTTLEARSSGRPAAAKEQSARLADGAQARYRSALKQWADLHEELKRVDGHYKATLFAARLALDERATHVDEVVSTFKHFKHEVGRAAMHQKSGRPISGRTLEELEARDSHLSEELSRARLHHIALNGKQARLESKLAAKDQLAEGLALIDFEQLRIENQSLAEKIEERTEELSRLKKKTNTMVQILTHMREKLQFVEGDNVKLDADLEQMEDSLVERRATLGTIKDARDKARTQGQKIKEANLYVTASPLLTDLEASKERRDDLLVEVQQLRQHHASLSEAISKAGDRIMAATDDFMGAGERMQLGSRG